MQAVRGKRSKHPLLALRKVRLTGQDPKLAIRTPVQKNPKVVIAHSRPDLNVPWGAFAHPDGKHILISGMPCYGRVGGGMDIYNIGQDTAPTTLVIPQGQVGKVHLDVGDAVSIMRVSRTHMIIKLLATNAPR